MRGTGDSLWGLVHDLLALGQDQLDVAWVAHVWVDLGISLVSQDRVEQGEEKTHTTVSTVCAATLLWCLVDLNVLDNQVGGIQTLGVGVGLSVLKKRGQELSRLDGPASLAHTKCLACCIVSVCLSAFRAYVSPSMHPRTDGHITSRWATYLGQYGQCSQHISSWAPPRPCSGHCRDR